MFHNWSLVKRSKVGFEDPPPNHAARIKRMLNGPWDIRPALVNDAAKLVHGLACFDQETFTFNQLLNRGRFNWIRSNWFI